MIAALSSPADVLSYTVIAGAFFYLVVQLGEKVGWFRTPSAWRDEAEGLKLRVEELEKENAVHKTEKVHLQAQIDTLKALPNYEALHALTAQVATAIAETNKMLARQLGIIELIAQRLGKDDV